MTASCGLERSRFLAIYDPLILGVYLRWLWRCPRNVLAELYRTHTGARHLDVGPGTGYFLDVADPAAGTAITLLDPNPAVLAHAAKRLSRYAPSTVQADACEPLPLTGHFASAGRNLVPHCIPGNERKAAAIRHVAGCLEEDGVLFGPRCSGHRRCTAGLDASLCPSSTGAGSSATARTPRKGSGVCCRRPSSTWPWSASARWPCSWPGALGRTWSAGDRGRPRAVHHPGHTGAVDGSRIAPIPANPPRQGSAVATVSGICPVVASRAARSCPTELPGGGW